MRTRLFLLSQMLVNGLVALGNGHTFVRTFLVTVLLANGILGFTLSLNAGQTRTWFGDGDGEHWSDPRNWIPAGVPQAGDDLIFEKSGLTTPTSVVNDLNGLSIRNLTIVSSFQFNFFATEWTLVGGTVTITGDIKFDVDSRDLDVHLDLPLKLGHSTISAVK